jgi:hypothetical protein
MIMDAARQITDWKEVQRTYRSLYSRDLLSDLQSELDSDEYNTFLRILTQSGSKAGGSNNGKSNSLKGMLIAAKKNIRLRSTPDSTKGTFSFNTNILTTAPAGTFLGFATGKVEVDNNGVKYLEVKIHFSGKVPDGALYSVYRKQKNKTLSFWVGAGAIDQFSDYSDMQNHGVKLYEGVHDLGLRTE